MQQNKKKRKEKREEDKLKWRGEEKIGEVGGR